MYLEDAAAEKLAVNPSLSARSQSREGMQGQPGGLSWGGYTMAVKIIELTHKKCCLGKKDVTREASRSGEAAVSSITTGGKR